MKRLRHIVHFGAVTIASCLLSAGASATLVSYWPLDELNAGVTPDIVSGYDMNDVGPSSPTVVPGQIGNAFSFDSALMTMLSRVHSAGDLLPINQHPSFTVSMWANVAGMGQNDDRLFSEGVTGDPTPLYNIGTQQGGLDGRLDLFTRPGANHEFSTFEPFDGTWHHIAMVTDEGDFTLYVDGVQDATNFVGGDLMNLNTTSIGGIERGDLDTNRCCWVTGLIDDVSLWRSALSEATIEQLAQGVTPSEIVGLGLPAGDVNGDMAVDTLDFEVIRDNFLRDGVLRSEGDLDLDGVVGLKDFKIWKNAAFPPGAASVPEPGTLGLAMAGMLLIQCSRRRRPRGL